MKLYRPIAAVAVIMAAIAAPIGLKLAGVIAMPWLWVLALTAIPSLAVVLAVLTWLLMECGKMAEETEEG